MYQPTDKMCNLMASGPEALQIISRFGLPLGVGDQTVEDVCRKNGIHTSTFLYIINRQQGKDIDIPTLQVYLRNAHTYFLDFALPRLRQELISAVSMVKTDNKIPMLIVQIFDQYVEEIRTHIAHENESVYPGHAEDDQHIAEKLSELKKLIIKYYPENDHNSLLYNALHDIYEIEQELALHCRIEDEILLPALQTLKQEELSDREKEVLIELVKGKSNKEIADVLCISTHTVISHRKNITRKLNIHSTAGLTIYAIVNKLVCLDELRNI